MIYPFHLSFVVPDKEEAKRFYVDVLGCSVGRDNEAWCDILFFGHQLTIHQATAEMPPQKLDHFGSILSQEAWNAVLAQCQRTGMDFAMQPEIKHQHEANESGKFMLSDPAGNVIEFKYYFKFSETVG